MLFAAALLVNSVAVPGTQLHVKLATQVGRPYDARTIAKDVRWLWGLGRFEDVRVEEPTPGDFVFRVKQRERLFLRDARLTPHSFGIELKLPPGTPIDRLRAREIARDIERQVGYPVEESLIPRGNGKVDLRLQVKTDKKKRKREKPFIEGIRYEVSKTVCRDLFRERAGGLEFRADFSGDGITTARGVAYRVGRIDIQGHHRHSDASVRRHLLLAEGDPFDERRLRRSLARINRTAVFDPLDERSVVVARDSAAGIANITLILTERKRGSWNVGGPWPFRASIGYGPLSLIQYGLRRAPVAAVRLPGGFVFAPQLGFSGMGLRTAIGLVQQRLGPKISGEGPAEGPLHITGEADAVCVAKGPRLRLLRTAATALLGFL